jgi:uroporphyrinogen-III decarboxylase
MTGRQRILNAVNHRPVDRVPIDLGGTRQSGIAALAYGRLRRTLGIDAAAPFKAFDVYQMLAEIEQSVAERFGSDTVALNRPAVAFGIRNEAWKPWTLSDDTDVLVPGGFNPVRDGDDLVLKRGDDIIARMPAGGFYFDRYEKYPGAAHPDISTWQPPRVSDSDLHHYELASRALADETDKAIIAAFGPPYELFNGIGQGGFEDWMVTFASEDHYVDELYRLLVDAWIENLHKFWEAVGERVQILQIADDFGTQAGPFLSEAMFREKLLPAYRRGLKWIHDHTPWKVLLHSDGAIRPLLPAIIEMGVDILNPVQTNVPGMEASKLVEDFGGQIAFWGGSCDAQGTLTRGTPEQVSAEVQHNLDVFRPLDGGFVFASVHNIQADVPADNIVAMFDAALSYQGAPA